MSANLRPVDPLSLPYVWRVQDLAGETAVLKTGHPLLDAHLPGQGWPVGSMVEILHQRVGQHAWQLLLPALVQAVSRQSGPVVLVGAPHEPFGPSLKAQGLPGERLLCVSAEKPAARLWAAEQALRCAEVAAVLAWLPQARSTELRRLHMAAQQYGQLFFVFRGMEARNDASPARLRLAVQGVDSLEINILKRRGPPLEEVLSLSAYSSRVTALLSARSRRSNPKVSQERAFALHGRSHVLDRTGAFTPG